ncbi:hypothetical protein [Brevibacterium spongiae]|uniref:Uncharacterized protein n=1 Tax=Brevibacterium spongiae TaxID=2909672 RepID=A0ABY5SPM3_9MICO|nr:hypothetical protein [Brevibacterium spongiae]UVI35001.1 hypothetical protein L1F31_12840 [Brevibacterium spongiae]
MSTTMLAAYDWHGIYEPQFFTHEGSGASSYAIAKFADAIGLRFAECNFQRRHIASISDDTALVHIGMFWRYHGSEPYDLELRSVPDATADELDVLREVAADAIAAEVFFPDMWRRHPRRQNVDGQMLEMDYLPIALVQDATGRSLHAATALDSEVSA